MRRRILNPAKCRVWWVRGLREYCSTSIEEVKHSPRRSISATVAGSARPALSPEIVKGTWGRRGCSNASMVQARAQKSPPFDVYTASSASGRAHRRVRDSRKGNEERLTDRWCTRSMARQHPTRAQRPSQRRSHLGSTSSANGQGMVFASTFSSPDWGAGCPSRARRGCVWSPGSGSRRHCQDVERTRIDWRFGRTL